MRGCLWWSSESPGPEIGGRVSPRACRNITPSMRSRQGRRTFGKRKSPESRIEGVMFRGPRGLSLLKAERPLSRLLREKSRTRASGLETYHDRGGGLRPHAPEPPLVFARAHLALRSPLAPFAPQGAGAFPRHCWRIARGREQAGEGKGLCPFNPSQRARSNPPKSSHSYLDRLF